MLFSETDKRPVDKDVSQFVYTRTSEAKDSAFVLIGSPKHDVNLYYHLVTNRGIVESKRYTLTDSLLHFSFAYKPEYGDAATAYFAFVRDGQIYSQSVSVVKPTPDKRLLLKWKTFRSRVTPGQHEEWQLQVTYPDGKPAESNVMACLYDASLDALAQSQRDFSRVDFTARCPALPGTGTTLPMIGDSHSKPKFNLESCSTFMFPGSRNGIPNCSTTTERATLFTT